MKMKRARTREKPYARVVALPTRRCFVTRKSFTVRRDCLLPLAGRVVEQRMGITSLRSSMERLLWSFISLCAEWVPFKNREGESEAFDRVPCMVQVQRKDPREEWLWIRGYPPRLELIGWV